MLGGSPGLKNAVLFIQSGAVEGLLTVCAPATVGKASNGANANNPGSTCERFNLMAYLPVPSLKARGRLIIVA